MMTLDRGAQRVLDMARLAERPPFETLTPAEARAAYRDSRRALSPEAPAVASVRDLIAAGPEGGAIPVRLYRGVGAAADAVLPALVFFHGGGWVIGDIDTHDVICRRLANTGRCAVASVDYRLAPEHKFPAAVEDAFAATAWLAQLGGTLGIDPRRLAVGGDSAGGNLAAVVALLARDRGGPALRFQLLIYPATDFAMDTESHRRCGEGYLLTRSTMLWFRDQYLRGAADIADWRASPLRASLAGLPPAYVLTAGYDPLCDEGEAYARALDAAGVRVQLRRVPGQIHGFVTMGKVIDAAFPELDAAAAALRQALEA